MSQVSRLSDYVTLPRAFTNDVGGAVAILFAFTAIPVFLTIGLAIDGARGYSTKMKLRSVLDSAALSTAKSMRDKVIDDDAARAIAEKYVTAHMQREVARHITTEQVSVAIDHSTNTVRLDLAAQVANFFGGIINIPTFKVSQSASASFGSAEVELGMMLDVSGSMADFGKIDDLKHAVGTLLDVLMPDGGGNSKVRVGIAPFSTSVNAGVFANQVKSGNLAVPCVSERKGLNAFTDAAPVGSEKLGQRASSCPHATVLALTDNKNDLRNAAAALSPGGNTAGHLGAAWAWYLISPNWSSIWPATSTPKAYDNSRIIKSVLLMTDGMFNQQYELAANGASAQQAIALCNSMKARGILVYTIGFQAPSNALAILQQCASSSTSYFDAQHADALNAAFARIAADLTELRLTR